MRPYKLQKLALVTFFIAISVQAFRAQSTVQLETPSFHIGDSWLFRHYEEDSHKAFRIDFDTVKSLNEKLVTIKTNRVDQDETSSEQEWKVGENPLQFPVFAGKTWNSNIYRNGKVVGKASFVAIDWEKISTPAGDFDTLKLETKYTIPSGTFTQQLWYAAAVRNFVKISYVDQKGRLTETMELLWFRLKK